MLKFSGTLVAACVIASCAMSPKAIPASAPVEVIAEEVKVAKSVDVAKASRFDAASDLAGWLRFIIRMRSLDALELARERDRLVVEHRERPNDGSRVALAYLLSQPQPLVRDLERSRILFAEVDSSSEFAPVRDLLKREVALFGEVTDLREEIARLQAQLDALKAIDADLTENQKDLEDVPQ